jgi:ABC-2 type transport system permease protein
MKNILLILRREYLVRVKKKSFIIMTFLAPLLLVGFYAAVIWIAIGSTEMKTVQVLDKSGLFATQFKDTDELKFKFITNSLDSAKAQFKSGEDNALVYIPENVLEDSEGVLIYAPKNVSLDLKSNIEKTIERQIEDIKLTEAGITRKVLEDSRVDVKSQTISLSDGGEKSSSSGAATAIGGICGFLIYISVFVYGTMVMRGVTEEKTSRIVEVIISSVKPYQLMLGKIIGVAMVGLTQFVLWILLTVILASGAGYIFKDQLGNDPQKMQAQMEQVQKGMPGGAMNPAVNAASGNDPANAVADILAAVGSLNLPYIIGCFLFYYLGGYLLYSALFGAVGAAVDNEADTQQFMLPITLPIVFSFVFAQMALRDPDGSLAFWTSIIPFTSPIVMMVRIPFGVPAWELALSMVLLVLGFIGTTWLAARIYRIGILMYGKKVNYKELAKWIFYKG